MSVAAAHKDAFFDEITTSGQVWTLRDAKGFPAPQGDGGRAMPFWSTRNRVTLIISNIPAYAGFEPVQIDLAAFLDRWLPGLERDGLRVGVNWSGSRAMGYDLAPSEVVQGIHAQRKAAL